MKYKIQNIFMYSEQIQNIKYNCFTNTVFSNKNISNTCPALIIMFLFKDRSSENSSVSHKKIRDE